jgi:hypothetical protein
MKRFSESKRWPTRTRWKSNYDGKKVESKAQGDQIGRIFSQWVIVYFGQLLENDKVSHILGYFIPRLGLCLN